MKMLEILSSPAHTLSARNRLVKIFETNEMPPVTGVDSHESQDTLIELAKRFKELGDKALEFDGETVDDALAKSTLKN